MGVLVVLAAGLVAGSGGQVRAQDLAAGKPASDLYCTKQIAATHFLRCTTVAGALDTYAKSILTGNNLYHLMVAPRQEQKAWETVYRTQGLETELYHQRTMTVYPARCGETDFAQGTRSFVGWSTEETYYQVGNLRREGEVYRALVVFYIRQHESGSWESCQGAAVYPVQVYWENGYVVAADGAPYLCLETKDYHFTSNYLIYHYLPPARTFAGEGQEGRGEAGLGSWHIVDNWIQTEASFFFYESGSDYDTAPKPAAAFAEEQRWCRVTYTFQGSQAERQATNQVRLSVDLLRGEADSPENIYDQTRDSIAPEAGEWDGTIVSDEYISSEDWDALAAIAVDIQRNGTAREAFLLKEVTP